MCYNAAKGGSELSDDVNDVKIFGEHQNLDDIEKEDSLVLELVVQKSNGNLHKAKQLGAILAAEVESNDGEFVFGAGLRREDQEILLQRRLLLAFVVDYGLNTFCLNKIISEIAINFFYDTIKNDSPLIYEDIRETGAFSYYYLCVRDGEQIEEEIGKTFAQLVGYKDNEVYAHLGTALFLHFIDVVKKKIAELNFVE